jgi:ABC-type branched-subunit amino acid transport system ATPase component
VAASRRDGTANTMRLVGLAKRFGGVTAIDDVDLTIEAGTVHGLIGSNGSGKTTILNMLSGFYRLDAGEIWLGETRIDRSSAAQVARAGVGRTFQTPKLLPGETLLDNVRAAADLTVPGHGVAAVLRLPAGRRAERESRERAMACIEAVGLGEYAGLPTERLPHGLRRLGEIARAMAMQPRVLLLDEPAAGLTQAELALLERAVRSAADQGMAVLLIEHNVPFVFGLADQVTALHLGRVIARGTPDEIRDDVQVAEAVLGSALQTDDPVDNTPMEASRV